MDRLIADFWDEASGTLFDTAEEHDRTVARPRSIVDSATPSANAVAADVLLRLALLTGEADYDRRARSILRAVAPALDRQPSAFGRMLSAVDRSLPPPIDAVIAGDPTDEAAAALRRAVARPYAPDLVIAGAPSDGTLGRAGRSSRASWRGTGRPPRTSAAATPAKRRPPIRGRRPRRSRAWPSARQEAEPHGPRGVVLVRIEQRHRLPRARAPSGRRPPAAPGRARPAAAGRDPRRGPETRGGAASGRHAAGADPARP